MSCPFSASMCCLTVSSRRWRRLVMFSTAVIMGLLDAVQEDELSSRSVPYGQRMGSPITHGSFISLGMHLTVDPALRHDAVIGIAAARAGLLDSSQSVFRQIANTTCSKSSGPSGRLARRATSRRHHHLDDT